MPYDPQTHHRRSIRLPDYDYTQPGACFVTLGVQNRKKLFGEIYRNLVQLSQYGQVAQHTWLELPKNFPHLSNEDFMIMPDHLHGLIIFNEPVKGGLPEVIRYYKSFTSRRINGLRDSPGAPVWHRNYYEHIVRNEVELNQVRRYIRENPSRWGK